MPTLILMRHGVTTWARQNRFAGWADAPLSPKGERQAYRAGKALSAAGLHFDVCHTSLLQRAQRSLDLCLEGAGQSDAPIVTSWRLNERHYGVLQGENRLKARSHYGNEQLLHWRRNYRARPPALEDGDSRLAEMDVRYAGIPAQLLPRSESLEDAALRVEPHWREHMAPALKAGKSMLVVSHSSSLRGLVRLVEGLDDTACESFRIATAVPLLYRLDDDLRVLDKQVIQSGLGSWTRAFLSRHKPGDRISWV